MDRALLVGINAYPGAPLSGCVNDVTDMAACLTKRCGFAPGAIRLLTDERATTAAILDRLAWLLDGLKAGDRALFHYSGHGAQVALRNAAGAVYHMEDVICPVDFDWSEERMIQGRQFHEGFLKVPPGVEFVWISDSCHSGELERRLGFPNSLSRHSKFVAAPADLAWRITTARQQRLAPRTFIHAAEELNLALIAGCRSDQSAADASFDGRPNGALTHFLLQALNAPDGLNKPLTALVAGVRAALKHAHYDQEPQLAGSTAVMKRGFLALPLKRGRRPVGFPKNFRQTEHEVRPAAVNE